MPRIAPLRSLKTVFRHQWAAPHSFGRWWRTRVAVALIVALLSPSAALAGPLAGSSMLETMWAPLFSFMQEIGQDKDKGMPQPERSLPAKQTPKRPPAKAEREAKVARVQINPAGDATLRSRDTMFFSAIPLDSDGNAIHGLFAEWASSDTQVISIKKDGGAIAVNPGRARLTASAGNKQASLLVTVVPAELQSQSSVTQAKTASRATRETLARVRRSEPIRARTISAGDALVKRAHASSSGNAAMPQAPPITYGGRLPDAETASLYWARNQVGSPSGRVEPGASTPAAATSGTEMPLSANFKFSVPLINWPGRGVPVALSLNYNSRLWHRSTNAGATQMTYDVDSGWPAPGFQLGFGHIEAYGTGTSFTLVDSDGTRHELRPTGTANIYDTVDSTFIRYDDSQKMLTYPDGTRCFYTESAATGKIIYPVQIMDRNGNYILISYTSAYHQYTNYWWMSQGPLISTIQDTQGRYITFNYDSTTGDLVTITVPGFAEGADRQVVRFYYQTISINPAGSFTVPTRAPTTARVLRFVYFPDTASGYRYDYSSYGMIYQIKSKRGMTVSTTSTTQTGTVTYEGPTPPAATTYDYPLTASSLSDAPQFTHRTDDWVGRTSATPVYTFGADQTTGTATITAPDNTVTQTTRTLASGQWNDGLITSTSISQGSSVFASTSNSWEHDGTSKNARVWQASVTNEASQTRSVTYTYTTYNNVLVMRELGFSGEELRRTEMTYVTNASWINMRLLHMPASVKVYAGGASVPSSWVAYAYDGGSLEYRDSIVMHEAFFDPYAQPVWTCVWNYISSQWVCSGSPYDPATNYRGNVTQVTRYINAADANQGSIVDTKSYDVVGNVTTETKNCCQQKSYEYDSSYYYADITEAISGAGPQQQVSAIYDFNTGLMTQSMDANGLSTSYDYDPNTLRPTQVNGPAGNKQIEYGDQLYADPDAQHMNSWVKTTTNSTIVTWQYVNGRGQVVRTFGAQSTANGRSTVDTEYDVMARPLRKSNPYYSTSGASSAINPSGVWTSTNYDAVGRGLQATLPDNTTIQVAYAGTVVTATDQGNKQRRRLTDALGRLIRLDEPDQSGNLGSVSAPLQPTSYSYDTLGNLVHIQQGAQHRYYKYDSLSRLTYEREPEQDAPHAATDPLTGNNIWSRKVSYNNPQGLVTDITDARQITKHLDYDGMNRVTQITYSDGTPTVSYGYDAVHINPQTGQPYIDPQTGQPYPNKGHLTNISTSNGTLSTSQTFDYNPIGKVAWQQETIGQDSYGIYYSYNVLGQMTSTNYAGKWIYNNFYHVWMYDGNGYNVAYNYDDASRLQSVTNAAYTPVNYDSGMTYNAAGAMTSETYGNSAVRSMSYNNRMQPTQISLTASNNVIQQYNYNYGTVDQTTGVVDTTKNNGKLGSVDAYIGGTPASPVKQWQERFSYDSLGRLDLASEYRGDNSQLSWRADYDYDQYGNRLQLPTGQSQNLNVNYTTIQSSDISATTNRYTAGVNYDPAGNITQDTKFHNQQYAYDANGRVKTSNPVGGAQATATYDALGQMVRTVIGATTQTIVYDIYGRVAAEYQNGNLQKWYIYRGAGKDVVAVVNHFAGDAKSYVMSDKLGSKRVVMDSSANVISRRDYLPYGEEISAGVGMRQSGQGYGSGDVVRERYATMLSDDVSSLDNTLWRKFDKTSGRWTSPDPTRRSRQIDNPQSVNRYSYAQNDPVNFVDPSGLRIVTLNFPFTDCWILVGFGDGWGDHFADLHCIDTSGGGEGRGAGEGGEGEPEPEHGTPCADFATALANRLYNANMKGPGAPYGSWHLEAFGEALMSDAIKNVNESGTPYKKGETPINDFKDELTANGQGADVYHHIMFMAATYFVKDGVAIRKAFIATDYQQSLRGRKESDTELLDDHAGDKVGQMMADVANRGKSGDYDKLASGIETILCKRDK